MALFWCLEKVSQKNSSGVAAADWLFLRFFCFFYSRFVLSFVFALLHGPCGCLKKMHLRRVSTFWVYHTPTKRRLKLFSQKSPEISNVHEKSFLAFRRESFRCAAEQQQLLFHRLCFFKIVLSRARVCIMYMRRAHFNYPSHGAALSHVVVTWWWSRKRTRARRLFRAKEEDKKKNR